METGKVCASSYKRLEKFLNSRNYIFAILPDKTFKLCLFTHFKVLSPAGSIVVLYQAYVKILNFRDKGLYVRHSNSCKIASGFKYFAVNLNE